MSGTAGVPPWFGAELRDVQDWLGAEGDSWARAFVERSPRVPVRHGSALLWIGVRRGRRGVGLANALFDSFFSHVPRGARAVAEGGPLVLPRLGLHLRAPSATGRETPSVEKVDDETLLVRRGSHAEHVPVAGLPDEVRIDGLHAEGNAQCNQSVVFDAPAVEALVGRSVEVARTHPADAPARLTAGLARVEAGAGGDIATRVRSHVEVVVPIASGPGERTSYSYRDAPGIVFVSPDESTDWIAEAIVHEAAHIELAAWSEGSRAVLPGEGNVLYSPWKDEPRPPEAVLHGAFSFWRVAEYLVECRKRGRAAEETARRTFQTLYRVRLALGQLSAAALTDEGRELVDMMGTRVRELSREASFPGETPLSVRLHKARWARCHPHLAPALRPPVE